MNEDTHSQIDDDLEALSSVEIANAYRAICAAMLLRTAQSMRCKSMRQDEVDMRRTAGRWLDGGGVITFDHACAALSLDAWRAKGIIRRYVSGEDGDAIKRMRTRSRLVSPRRKKNGKRRRKDPICS